jgi:uncharacterized protein YcbX
MAGKVTSLVVYPVKGCAGTALAEARLLERGLEHDRRWMLVDRHGRFVTQRELPALARVRPSLNAVQLEERKGYAAGCLLRDWQRWPEPRPACPPASASATTSASA